MSSDHHRRLIAVRPLHLVASTSDGIPVVARRPRGRPRRVVAVAPDQDEYQTCMMEHLKAWTESDDVVQATAQGIDSREILQRLLVAVAREAAALGFDRLEAAKKGKDISILSGRRVRSLLRVGELRLLLAEAEAGTLSLDAPQIDIIEKLWLEHVQDAARETLAEPDTFMVKLKEIMSGWRERPELRGCST